MTIINFNKNFIFIHPRRTGGSSLVLALLRFCSVNDKICDDVLSLYADKWIEKELSLKFKPKIKKKFNFNGVKTFFVSFLKILPFINKIIKFNYPPSFNLQMPFYVHVPNLYSHATVDEVRNLCEKKFFENAFKFTIVRNPYDQFLSFFRASGTEKNFHSFTKDQAQYFFNREINHFYQDKNMYDKIIKFENFEKDISELSKLLDLNENVFKIFKKIKVNEFKPNNKKKLDKNIIDLDSQKIIYKTAKKIFEDYNYKKEI
jgi:hypothetical protein